MAATNSIIHFAAFIAFVGLCYALVRLQKQRVFMLSTLKPHTDGGRKFSVDWPLAHVQRFADAFAISLHHDPRVGSQGEKPKKLRVDLLPRLLVNHGISTLRLTSTDTTPHAAPVLEITTHDGSISTLEWSERLSAGLHLATSIRVLPLPHKAPTQKG